ncbi:MAG: thioredoxin-disulfide reductase [Candidatus Riflebacteria bacterium]|nr:thioredoxin-disulfide reductase [Candidatus Riflebacteria bacterium]
MSEKLVIIGSGPAGLTAAIYAARANLEPFLFEGFIKGGLPGGQLMTTTEVENFPGFEKGLMGPDLIMQMRAQAVRFGARMIAEDVETVDISKHPFILKNATRTVEAHAIIIATGASANILEAPGVKKFWGKGISACATCDGALPLFRGKALAVAGGGDSAIEEATFLARFASKVTIIHRRDALRASHIMQERARKHPKIELLLDSVIEEIVGGQLMTGLRLRNVKTGKKTDREFGGLFMGIGHTPNTAFLNGSLALDEKGYIKVSHPSTATSVEGIFAAGDVTDPHYRQAISAAGSGCIAALDAERYLDTLGID